MLEQDAARIHGWLPSQTETEVKRQYEAMQALREEWAKEREK